MVKMILYASHQQNCKHAIGFGLFIDHECMVELNHGQNVWCRDGTNDILCCNNIDLLDLILS